MYVMYVWIMHARNTLSISSQFDYTVKLQTDKLRYFFLLREKTMPTTKKIAFFSKVLFYYKKCCFGENTEREKHVKQPGGEWR